MASPSVSQPPDSSAHDALAHIADRIGATASFLCALHCAALPFVLTVLPALGLGFLGDHRFERAFIAFASVLASAALIRGWRRHRAPYALYLLVPGLVLLWTGAWVFDTGSAPILHAVLVTLGGCGVALAHIVNMRLTHLFGCCPPATSA
ncbi:MAG: MerC domain-containing protein [Rudaea sp.]|uniref:MerC domain-containing protein n=1 Tax=unclassified Rudaea TaxID=2627037 RepID=UPI0010F602F7|nr:MULTISPECIES: MerC domain-containing protein [unclassified Rudaea]MBN8884301.1 MerC domain-containing protein [Rudaea sp.]MBR0346556.1 MerC domain-containing protein [Rudaea sp.]